MTTKLDEFNKSQIKKQAPDIRPGDVVRVHVKLPEKTKRGAEKVQVFEGLVIACKHGKNINSTFTVRKISDGVGIERIFPIFCPSINKIEIVKRSKVRKAKLYYMRDRTGKKARMKTKELLGTEWVKEEPKEEPKEEAKKEIEKNEKEEPIQENLEKDEKPVKEEVLKEKKQETEKKEEKE